MQDADDMNERVRVNWRLACEKKKLTNKRKQEVKPQMIMTGFSSKMDIKT